MTETQIDLAHAAMQAAPEDDQARLTFYERMADYELFLLLESEPVGDQITPELFELQDGAFVLAFDQEERLAAFAGRIVPYAAISGRALFHMLAGQNVGLAFNLEVAPSSTLLPSEAIGWLSETLSAAPQEQEAKPEEFYPPADLPERLITALDAKLARAGGLARKAYLAAVTYEGGGRGHVLGFTGAMPGAEPALAQAINEALIFSGLEAGALDVTFLADNDPRAAGLAKVALRFDLPEPPEDPSGPKAPGMDPATPPKLV